MNPVTRQRQNRARAQRARARFEDRFVRFREGVDEVTRRSRTAVRENALDLLPWVFSIGLVAGMRYTITLGGLLHGALRAGRMSQTLGTTASAAAHTQLGQEMLSIAEHLISPEHGGETEQPAPPEADGARYH